MVFMKKMLVFALLGVAAALFNYLYNYIGDGHRGLMMFFCLATVLRYAMTRQGAE